MKQVASNLIVWAARIGADPNDDDDIQLQKSMLVLCALPFAFAGVVWGSIYVAFGELLAGAFPFLYSTISLASIGHFSQTRHYGFFRFSQLFIILMLPFLLMLTLGGYIQGSAVILWAVICPIGAMLFDEPSNAPRWFLAFAALVILSGFLEFQLDITSNLPLELVTFFFVINLLGVGLLLFVMVFFFVGQKNAFQEQSQSLLLNILPKDIVAILKNEQRTIADHFEAASVLFADLVDFTPMSASMSPIELVTLLDEVFSRFDRLAEKYGLEKIKTIGDCYMVASGVPRARADHAQILARMALDMRDFVREHEIQGRKLSFRYGLNSGPVVAGVIGRKKFTYDLWGEVVNTASRMESQGQEDLIQITRSTYDLIKDEFVCQRRGMVEIKGKGQTETWFVIAAKGEAA